MILRQPFVAYSAVGPGAEDVGEAILELRFRLLYRFGVGLVDVHEDPVADVWGIFVTCFFPKTQIFPITWRDLTARHQKEIACVHAFAREQHERVSIARVHPYRRMRFL